MRYALKIIPTEGMSKMPKYTVQVEEANDGSLNWGLADLDEKLVSKLNAALFEEDITLDDELFDQVDQSIIFSDIKKVEDNVCPHCGE